MSYANCWDHTRYAILVLTTFCLSLLLANSLALNFTVICMREEPSGGSVIRQSPAPTLNSTANTHTTHPLPRHLFSEHQERVLFSAVGVGSLIGSVPVIWLTSTLGTRWTFTLYGLLSALSTLATPLLVAVGGFIPLCVARVLQGVALSVSFTAMGSVTSTWAALKSSGVFIAYLACHLQLGPIISMPLAGVFCSSTLVTWRELYYLLVCRSPFSSLDSGSKARFKGALTLVGFTAFYFFYTDSPRDHPHVSDKEADRIEAGRDLHSERARLPIPYRQMVVDPSVWGLVFSFFCVQLAIRLLIQYGPIYLHKVLGFSYQQTGMAASLPHMVALVVRFAIGPLSDYAACVGERARVVIFTSSAKLIMCVCYAALALLPAGSHPILIQIAFSGVLVSSSLNAVGVLKSLQLVCTLSF